MNTYNSLIVCYRPPTSYKILSIMKENSLIDDDDRLLKNIEKVIPVSKVLRCKKYKDVKSITYMESNGILLFYIYN